MRFASLSLVIASMILAGCGSSHRARGDGGSGTDGGRDGSTPPDGGMLPDGGEPRYCFGPFGTDCGASEFCDFPAGCGGEDVVGICQPRPSGCDLIYDPVCGCDGNTYGNECAAHAAGVDVLYRGSCDGPMPTLCTADLPCVGGVCTGDFCGEPWQCLHLGMPCTEDAAPYCGCDGTTFYASSTCPDRPYVHRGPCESGGVNCDQRFVSCDALPPTCAMGEAPRVVGGCWGECVPISECACARADDCPMPETYTCHGHTNRCGPYL